MAGTRPESAYHKSVGLWYGRDGDPWGHSILQLVDDLAGLDQKSYEALRDLREAAGRLDRLYVPTRCPNGLPDITPEAAFFESDAREAGAPARGLVDRVADLLSGR